MALPDGRIQTVKYIADDGGFRAEVTYEQINPIKSSTPSPIVVTTSWPLQSNTPARARKVPNFSSFNHPKKTNEQKKQLPITTSYFSLGTSSPPQSITNQNITPPPHVRNNIHTFPTEHPKSSFIEDDKPITNIHQSQRILSSAHRLPSVNPRPVLTFDDPPKPHTIRPPTLSPNRNKPRVHRPTPLRNDRIKTNLFPNIQDNGHPQSLPINQPVPDILHDWVGDFNQKRKNIKHKPVKPSPVQISYNRPNIIPFYPGINFPSSPRSIKRDDVRNTKPKPAIIQQTPQKLISSDEIDFQRNSRRNPILPVKNDVRVKKPLRQEGQIDFKEHIHVTTPSPNPFRVTLSSRPFGMGKVRSRTTSRGRVITVAAKRKSTNRGREENASREPSFIRRKMEDNESQLRQLHQVLRNTVHQEGQIPFKNNITKSKAIVSSTPSPVNIIAAAFSPSREMINPTTSAPVFPPTFLTRTSFRSTTPTTLIPVASLVPDLDTLRKPMRNDVSKFFTSEEFPIFPPLLPKLKPRSPKVYRYQPLPENSRESREETALYSPNSPIFIKALGKSRTVPLLLPFTEDTEKQLTEPKNEARILRYVPYQVDSKLSNSDSPIFSPIPLISFIDR